MAQIRSDAPARGEESIELTPRGTRLIRRHRLKGALFLALLGVSGPALVIPAGQAPPLLGWAIFLMFMPVLPFWLHAGAGGMAVRVTWSEDSFHIGKSSTQTVAVVLTALLGFACGGIAILAGLKGDPLYRATHAGARAAAVGVLVLVVFGSAALLGAWSALRRGGLIADGEGIRIRDGDPPIPWSAVRSVDLVWVERLEAFRLDIRHGDKPSRRQVYVPPPESPAGQALLALLRRHRGTSSFGIGYRNENE